jgi:ankyrin repeat protein
MELEGGRAGTPLIGACEAGHLQTIKVLVRQGAKLIYLNKDGQEVSAIALAKHYPRVMR